MSGVPVHGAVESLGSRAAAVLDAGSGRVLAAFNRAVYVENETGIACVGAELESGPLSVRVCLGAAPWPRRFISAPATWSLRDRVLCVDRARFHLESAQRWRPGAWPSAPAPAILSDRAAAAAHASNDRASAFLAVVVDRIVGANRAGEGIGRAAADAMSALARWLGAPCVAVPSRVAGLIGCGPGLTPSGDDLLGGVGLVLRAVKPNADFESFIAREAPARTSRISAAHLIAAVSGEAMAPLHTYVGALLEGDLDAVVRAGAALTEYGHSSGLDAMAGVLLCAHAGGGHGRKNSGDPE